MPQRTGNTLNLDTISGLPYKLKSEKNFIYQIKNINDYLLNKNNKSSKRRHSHDISKLKSIKLIENSSVNIH